MGTTVPSETVAEHFHIAEYVGSNYSAGPVLGHFYYYVNDPTGHDLHVHVAFNNPFWGPDGANTVPPVLPLPERLGTPSLLLFDAAVTAKFGAAAYPSDGVYVVKHRNHDDTQPWSQHTGANAKDYHCDHAGADKFVAWLESEYVEEDEDMAVTKDDYEQRAYNWGRKERRLGRARPTKGHPNIDPNKPDEDYSASAQAGWDEVDGKPLPPVV